MSKLNRNLLIIAAICFVLGIATRIMNNLPPSNPYALTPQEQARMGQPAPQFTFTDIRGDTHSLSDFQGKVVVLNFWATWCPPCVKEFPQMLNLARETQREAVYIFLSNDNQTDAIARFVERLAKTHAEELKQANVMIAHDPGKAITHALFQSYRLPETYILTPDHILAEKIIGASLVWDAPEIVEKIRGTAKNGG